MTPSGRPLTDWAPVRSAAAEVIPSHAVARVTGQEDGAFTVDQVAADGDPDVVVLGPGYLPPGETGLGTWDPRVTVCYEEGDGTPAAGEEWGPAAGSWKVRAGYPGFRILGGAGRGLVNAVRARGAGALADLSFYRHAEASGSLGVYLPGGIITGNDVTDYSVPADQVHVVALVAPRVLALDRIGVNVGSAAAAGKKARLAIYDTAPGGADLWPRDLVVDTGEFAIDSTGAKLQTVAVTLAPGLYWLAYVADGTALVTGTSDVFMYPIFGCAADLTQYMGLRFTRSYGAFPSTFPAKDASYLASGNFAIPYVRVAA